MRRFLVSLVIATIVIVGCLKSRPRPRATPGPYELEVAALMKDRRADAVAVSRYVVGDRVTAYWKPDGGWYPGRVVAIRGEKADVDFDDGEKARDYTLGMIQRNGTDPVVSCATEADPDLAAYCTGNCDAITMPDLRAFCEHTCASIKQPDYRQFCSVRESMSGSYAEPTPAIRKECQKITDKQLKLVCGDHIDQVGLETWQRRRRDAQPRPQQVAPVQEAPQSNTTCLPNGAHTEDHSGAECCSKNASPAAARENHSPDYWFCCDYGTPGCQ